MVSSNLLRRAGIVAICLGATAVIGVAPAAAVTDEPNGENIFGMGSSLQGIAQINSGVGGTSGYSGACPQPAGWNGWSADWLCVTSTGTSNQSGLENTVDDPADGHNVKSTYTVESSGQGLGEFGDQASSSCTPAAVVNVLNPQCDPTANGQAPSELDAYIGTDDPTNLAQLNAGTTAAGAGETGQVTVPILQAPVALILSVPVGITIGTGGEMNLSGAAIATLWGAANNGTENWCTLLSAGGLTKDPDNDTPTATEYSDPGGVCSTDFITLQARSKGSGTTFSFRGYLYELSTDLSLSDYPYSLVTDGPSDWPVTVSETGNTSGGNLVADTTAAPGSVGYANLADAALATPGYKDVVQTTTTGGTHQILYAEVQNNLQSDNLTVTPTYASPAGGTLGTANVYTGANINTTQPTCVGAHTVLGTGCWIVPTTATFPWSSQNPATPGTIPSDPDMYDHSGKTATYPIVAASYDVAWAKYSAAANLTNSYNDSSCIGGPGVACTAAAGATARSYLEYLDGAGQANLASAHVYYAKMPSVVAEQGQDNAATITP